MRETNQATAKPWAPRLRSLSAALAATLFLAAAPAGIAAEAAPDSITAAKAVEEALAKNLGVKAAAIESRIKKRASDWSFNKFLPTVSLSGSFVRLNDKDPETLIGVPNPTAPTTLVPYYYELSRNNIALGLTIQEVFSAVYFGLMDQAAIDYRRSLISKAQAERSIAAAAKKIFYQLLVQDQAIELTRAQLETAKERQRQAKLLYDLGQGTELNYNYATMSVEGLAPALRAMESGRAAALIAFQELLGFDSNPAMKLDGSLDEVAISVDELAVSEADRFDVRLARQNEKQIESGLKIQRYALLPSLIVRYAADPTINGPWGTNSMTGEKIDFWDKDNWSQNQGALSITLSWDLSPILPFSSIRQGKAELQDRLELARENTAQAMRTARNDAENQLRAIRDSADKIASLSRVAESSKRAFELTSAAYQLGTGRILDLQDAEVAWQGARIQLLNERLKIASLAFDFEAKYQLLEIGKPKAESK